MARSNFGGTSNDLVYALTGERLLRAAAAGLTVTFWSAATGGARYTDLLLGGAAVDHVDVGTSGVLPQFQGPDGVTAMWADAGGGRSLLTIPGVGGGVTSYNALTDKPTIPNAPGDIGAATAAQGTKADSAVQPLALTTAVSNAIAGLTTGAPGALDTLDELASALGDDANYAATVTTALAARVPMAPGAPSGRFRGIVSAHPSTDLQVGDWWILLGA